MKTILIAMLLTLVGYVPAHANGSSVRGGGKGIVCRDPHGKIRSVELLDLWEARKFYNRKISESPASVADQAKRAVNRLRNINNYLPSMTGIPNLPPEAKVAAGVWRLVQPFLTATDPGIRRLKGVALTLTDDSFEAIQPQEPGCAIEQIVVYQDRTGQGPEILMNQDIYDQMSVTQKAALVVHESLYAYLRMFPDSDTDSIRTRRVVGYVFAGLTFPRLGDTLPSTYTTCYIEKRDKEDREPFLFFFNRGTDFSSLKVIRNYDLRFRAMLGYFPAQVSASFNRPLDPATQNEILQNVFSEHLCELPAMKDPQQVISGGLTMPGTGPADYDHTVSVMFACLADGTRELKMIQGDVIEPDGQSRTRDLYCEESR